MIDQSILEEVVHIEHKGKRILTSEIKETSKRKSSHIKVREEGSLEALVEKLGLKPIEQGNNKREE